MIDKKDSFEPTNKTLSTSSSNIPESKIVTTITLPNGGLPQKKFFDPSTPSNVIGV